MANQEDGDRASDGSADDSVQYLYHGTSLLHALSIQQEGLEPTAPDGPWPEYDDLDDEDPLTDEDLEDDGATALPDEAFEARVFASALYGDALEYAGNHGTMGCVLRIASDGDWDVGQTDWVYYYTTAGVPVDALDLHTVRGWVPLKDIPREHLEFAIAADALDLHTESGRGPLKDIPKEHLESAIAAGKGQSSMSEQKTTDDGWILEVFARDVSSGFEPGWYYHYREQGAPPDHTFGAYKDEDAARAAAAKDQREWELRQQGDDSDDRGMESRIGSTYRLLRDATVAFRILPKEQRESVPAGSLITYKGSSPTDVTLPDQQHTAYLHHFQFQPDEGGVVEVFLSDKDGPLGQWIEIVPRFELEAQNKAGRKLKP